MNNGAYSLNTGFRHSLPLAVATSQGYATGSYLEIFQKYLTIHAIVRLSKHIT